MRVGRALSLLTAAALSLSLIALPRPAAAQSSVLLRYHFSQHQKASYQLVMNLTGAIPLLAPKLNVAESVPFTQTVASVEPDGSGHVSYAFTTATTTLNGQSTTSPLTASTTERISPTGKATVLQAVGLQNQFGGVLNLDPSLGAPQFPATPVAVGSHWPAKEHIVLGSIGVVDGTLTYTLTSLTKTAGHTIATLTGVGTLPVNVTAGLTEATGTAAVNETVLFDATSGTLNSINGKIKISAALGGQSDGQSTGLSLPKIGLNLQVTLTKK